MSNSLPADMLTATDQIYLSLWNQICSLDLLPGEKLSEVRLAAVFPCVKHYIAWLPMVLWMCSPKGEALSA